MRCIQQIQIGQMDTRKKPVRGSRINIRCSKSASADGVLLAACKKYAAHDKNFSRDFGQWTLRYADGSVADTLPESGEPFQLQKYKQELMKDYQKIVMFLSKGKLLSNVMTLSCVYYIFIACVHNHTVHQCFHTVHHCVITTQKQV